MTIKNSPFKPKAIITRIGPKPSHMDELIYEHVKSQLNHPLPVNSLHYFEDGLLCHISISLPELQKVVDENTVVSESALFFSDEDVDITLMYGEPVATVEI